MFLTKRKKTPSQDTISMFLQCSYKNIPTKAHGRPGDTSPAPRRPVEESDPLIFCSARSGESSLPPVEGSDRSSCVVVPGAGYCRRSGADPHARPGREQGTVGARMPTPTPGVPNAPKAPQSSKYPRPECTDRLSANHSGHDFNRPGQAGGHGVTEEDRGRE